jgi:hypothetical protein
MSIATLLIARSFAKSVARGLRGGGLRIEAPRLWPAAPRLSDQISRRRREYLRPAQASPLPNSISDVGSGTSADCTSSTPTT